MEVGNIAKWDGSAWSRLGPPGRDVAGREIDIDWVGDIAIVGKDIYARGRFSTEGIKFNGFAKLDAGSWSPFGSAADGGPMDVASLAVIGTDLYVGGTFTRAGGVDANRIAKWDGREWSPLGHGLNGHVSVSSLAV